MCKFNFDFGLRVSEIVAKYDTLLTSIVNNSIIDEYFLRFFTKNSHCF